LRGEVHHWASSGEAVYIEFTLIAPIGRRLVRWDVVDRFIMREGRPLERVSSGAPGAGGRDQPERLAALPARRGAAVETPTAKEAFEMTTSSASPTIELPQGTIRYSDSGNGEPLVFVHGFLVDSSLWQDLVPRLQPDFRCICPDLPLGSHPTPMRPDADLSAPGVATLVADFIERLGLEQVTLVGNDSGGALSQLMVTSRPERVGRLVLTNCDAYENFPPLAFRYLTLAARIPGALTALTQSMRLGFVRRAPIAYGWLTKRRLDSGLLRRWTEPSVRNGEIRRDARKFLRGTSPRQTLEAAEKLRSFERPTLLAWGEDDRFFGIKYAERLAADIPNARLERIPEARTFVALDQPGRLADILAAFMREPLEAPASAP
jgi:pimeloyl-ACP methyl ester carboxylesterase